MDPTAGVTRDRVSADVTYSGRTFELIDTGGIGLFDEALLKEEVERQIAIALDLADVLIFLVDVREGLTPLDTEVAGRLRKCGKPVVVVANKADTIQLEEQRHVFHSLGFGDPLAASAHEGRGVFAVLARVVEILPPQDAESGGEDEQERIKVAVVGRVNAGKSSLVNRMAREDRVMPRDHGRIVVAGGFAGPVVTLDLRRLYLGQKRIIGSTIHTREHFARLATLARTGAVRPAVAHVFGLEEIHAAQMAIRESSTIGKVVIDVGSVRPGA